MNINTKKIMITTAILATIGGSLLFASQNYDIQPNHQNIQNVVSILEAPSKTETKINTNTKNPQNQEEKIENTDKKVKKYTNNLSAERVENMTYLVRDDGWIPYYLEPIDINDPYYPAFYGEIFDEYLIYFDISFDINKVNKNYVENLLGHKILKYKDTYIEDREIFIKIQLNSKNAQEVEQVKNLLDNLRVQKIIEWYTFNSGVLPEYRSDKYFNIMNELDDH